MYVNWVVLKKCKNEDENFKLKRKLTPESKRRKTVSYQLMQRKKMMWHKIIMKNTFEKRWVYIYTSERGKKLLQTRFWDSYKENWKPKNCYAADHNKNTN